MIFTQHYSSSKGNLYEVRAANGQRILLECGVRWPLIQKAIGYNLRSIKTCLLTHEHKDHSKSSRHIIENGIELWANQKTLNEIGLLSSRHGRTVQPGFPAAFTEGGTFEVRAYKSVHDAVDPLLFNVRCDDEWLLFAPDTCNIQQRFNLQFSIIAIECSFDRDILEARRKSGQVHEAQAVRLWASHMEKRNCIRYLDKFCDKSRLREIHLIHCSEGNLDAEAARAEVEEKFMIPTFICGGKDAKHTT